MNEDKKDQNLIDENKPQEQLSRKLRVFIFLILISLSVLINCDNGILSFCKKQIIRDFQLDEKGYRLLNKIVLYGTIFCCIVFIYLLQTDRKRLLTLVCFFINGVAFFSYYLTFNRRILYIVKFLNVICIYYSRIYILVWVDQFGIKKYKIMMMTINNFTVPLGKAVGYCLGALNGPDKWYLNYMIIGSLILGFGSLLLIFPSKYFSNKYNFIGYQKEGEEGFVNKVSGCGSTSFFENEEMKIRKTKKESLLAALKNPVYFLSVLAIAIHNFCLQTINSTIVSYIIDDIKMNEEEKTTKFLPLYGSATVFGPLIGDIFGVLCGSCVGGYEEKKSVFLIRGFATFALLSSFLVIYSDSAAFLCVGLFLFNFFVFALYPIINGYIVSSIPNKFKGSSFSISILFYYFFGYLGPTLYTFLKKVFKDATRLPWRIIIHMFTLGFFAFLGSAYYRYYELERIEKEEENKINEEELKEIETLQ